MAEHAGRKRGAWGGDGSVREVWIIQASEGVYYRLVSQVSFSPNTIIPDEIKRKKEAALSKLSLEERKLLGLDS